MRFTTSMALLSGAVLFMAGPAVAAGADSEAPQAGAAVSSGSAQSSRNVENITVVSTGSRGLKRTVLDSPVPIDVLSRQQLQKVGGTNTNLRDALSQLLPSFQVNTSNNQSGSSIERPAQLRGLSLAHVLVLVDGKRRHNSAIVNSSAWSQAAGANTADLDLIPVSAIDHIEVLRDGAAAQYGSDAIAGVINIILKKNASGGSATSLIGQRYPWNGIQDGQTYEQSLNGGFSLPRDGFVNLAVDGKLQNWTRREGLSTDSFFFKLPGGQPDPREKTIDKRVSQGGLPQIKSVIASYNAEAPITPGMTLYSFATYGLRHGQVGQTYRLPNSTSDITQIYGDSIVQPSLTLDETDFQVNVGARGDDLFGWNWDLSTSDGRDQVHNHQIDTLNPSLGPASPTRFDTYNAAFTEIVTNLDLSRALHVGLVRPLQVSWGVEHRYESYTAHPQDPLAYANGGYIFPSGPLAGKRAAIGAQGATTILPENAANLSRANYAGYVDVAYDLTRRWLIDIAGRLEHYDDSAGDVASGKVSTRYKLTDRLILRGTVSNGFRAPSLSQSGFSTSSTGFNPTLGSGLTTTRLVPPGSALAQALGASDLKPERSTNYSIGAGWAPNDAIDVALDLYRIILNDRIAQTGFLSGSGVNAILAADGFATGQSISYYANAINTSTNGLDLTVDYRQHLGDLGTVRWDLGFNWNTTQITHVNGTPPQLAGLGLTLFDRVSRSYITDYDPKTKLILGGDWTWHRLDVNLHVTRYGQYDLAYSVNAPATDQHYAASWITDLDVAYKLSRHLVVAVGANNLFNIYPSHSTVPDSSGSSLYASNSPFGQFGGFYYGRLQLLF